VFWWCLGHAGQYGLGRLSRGKGRAVDGGDVRAGGGPHKKALLSRQLSQAYASKKVGVDEAK